MKKIIVIALLVVVAAAAGAFYKLKFDADKETDNITQLQKVKMTAKELEGLATEQAKDFRTAMAAAEKSGELGLDKQLELWKKQLTNESSAVRMKAAQELIKLEAELKGEATMLLDELSKDDTQDSELRLMVQKKLADGKLAGKKGAELTKAAQELLADPRPGIRLAALEALASDPCEANKALLKKSAETEQDEDVQMMAEMLLEELDGGGEEEGDE